MTKCMILALYLPQFHQIPENDEWWGEGFTEWTAVKRAERLSKYSNQPRIPLEGYYDLSNASSIRYQSQIAKKYCIDGFIIYHYYSNGKMLLSKPAELLKENREIDIKYCFSWANHDWRRTWYGYNKEILMKQEYGNLQQIHDHFNYLLSFFLDERYIKIDNKPVISIYRHEYIDNFELYYKTWNELAIKHGFAGVYFIQTMNSESNEFKEEYFSASFCFEPGYTIRSKMMRIDNNRVAIKKKLYSIFNINKVADVRDYRKVSKIIENRQIKSGQNFLGVFTDWDNTPRYNINGTVYKNADVESFKRMFSSQYMKSIKNKHKMLVINSWNEWSEGAYLEADTTSKFSRLDVIREVVRGDADE